MHGEVFTQLGIPALHVHQHANPGAVEVATQFPSRTDGLKPPDANVFPDLGHEIADDFRVALEPCDFFYSVIVLQHNPPPVIMELIRIALTALKPGGVAMFQVPTHINDYRFDLKEWLATDHALDMQMHCVPQEAVLNLITATGCYLLGLREDGCTSLGRSQTGAQTDPRTGPQAGRPPQCRARLPTVGATCRGSTKSHLNVPHARKAWGVPLANSNQVAVARVVGLVHQPTQI